MTFVSYYSARLPTVPCWSQKINNLVRKRFVSFYKRAVIQSVASKSQTSDTRKQIDTTISDNVRRLIGYLNGHRSLFFPGKGFNTVAATLFRKLDTASAYPSTQELQVARKMVPGTEAVIPIVSNRDSILEAVQQSLITEKHASTDKQYQDILFSIFKKFFRMLIYAIAVFSTDYISEPSFCLLEELFREMKVHPGVLRKGFQTMKSSIRQVVPIDLWKDTEMVMNVLESRLEAVKF
eukprot:jgi/Galph1/5280/GphlegSOOS_G3979.1